MAGDKTTQTTNKNYRVVPEFIAGNTMWSVERKRILFGWVFENGFFETKEKAEEFINLKVMS
jgi:hypothetical protein